MRYLPFVLIHQPELSRLIRSAAEDPQRRMTCTTCGGRIPVRPEAAKQNVRCPHCWRWQQARPDPEQPWRLSESAAMSLRRTKTWARHIGPLR
jgi:predicted RNA-binding Zn-ribbon protein involved in translation (DUF1610 family)